MNEEKNNSGLKELESGNGQPNVLNISTTPKSVIKEESLSKKQLKLFCIILIVFASIFIILEGIDYGHHYISEYGEAMGYIFSFLISASIISNFCSELLDFKINKDFVRIKAVLNSIYLIILCFFFSFSLSIFKIILLKFIILLILIILVILAIIHLEVAIRYIKENKIVEKKILKMIIIEVISILGVIILTCVIAYLSMGIGSLVKARNIAEKIREHETVNKACPYYAENVIAQKKYDIYEWKDTTEDYHDGEAEYDHEFKLTKNQLLKGEKYSILNYDSDYKYFYISYGDGKRGWINPDLSD